MLEETIPLKQKINSKLDFSLTPERYNINRLLKGFEHNLCREPLSLTKLKLFFSTLWAFYKETPTGILALSLRLADQWMDIDEWEATSIASYLFHADIHEFGLESMEVGANLTHHQLFLRTCSYFNITRNDLQNPQYILNGGRYIGELSYQYYREYSIGEALGFHLDSEVTSEMEFNAFLNGFLAHKDHFGIQSKHDESMELFFIHSVVEPEHSDNSEKLIEIYSRQFPDNISLIQKGFDAYMEGYYRLFEDLNKNLFETENSN